MQKILKGKVWTFGENVDTDVITPGKYLDNLGECKKHVLETLDPEFPENVKEGDIIIADKNFGCGSSRETAPEILQDMGVAVVVAPSFGRIFYRNSFSIGFPLIECDNIINLFDKGDEAEVNLETAAIKNLTSGKSIQCKNIPDILMDILENGGQLKLLKAELKARNKAEKKKK
ncbi:MAG: 3-isopropylmalate dehydratase [Promethearchaeota archaeon]|nr:MAG: 3-isopropylmalate dehydratase [Candidatus Lokiarchaeota archaeon]